MFAALGSSIRVEDLIRGVIVQSANDGCIILANGGYRSRSQRGLVGLGLRLFG